MAWLTLSALKSRSLPIRHKGARASGHCSATHLHIGHRIARRQSAKAANRFAGIHPMLPNALCPAAVSAAMSGRAPRSRRRGSTQRLLVQALLPVDMPAESSDIACRAAAHPRIGRPGAGKAACLAFRLPPSRLADAKCNVPCPGRRGPSIYKEGRKAPSSPLRTPDVCRM